MRGRDHAHARLDCRVAANSFELLLLEHAQHFCLKQAVLRAAAPVLVPEDLPANLREAPPEVQAALELLSGSAADAESFIHARLEAGSENLYAEFLDRMERLLVAEVLNHTEGNQVRAAKILGIARNSLRKKIRNLGITIGRSVASNGDDLTMGDADA